MLNDDSNLESLITQAIDIEQFRKSLSEKNKFLNKKLDELLLLEMAWLQQEAEELIKEFNDLKLSVKLTKPMRDWASLEVLLRVNKYSFAIEWRQNIFKKINGNWQVFHQLMKLNHSTLIYSFAKAKRAKLWELEKAIYLEGKFKIIRVRLRKLIALRKVM